MPKYSNLNNETLESLLKTHMERLIQLLADLEAAPNKILSTQQTIEKIESAIRANRDFGCVVKVS